MTEPIFSPSFGNRPSYLVGRETVISTFISGLEQEPGNRDRAMLMLGQRGSGKTVLLWELADRARKLGFVVATPTVASEDMLERIVEKIQEAGEPYVNKRRIPKLTSGSLSVFGFSAGLEFTRDVQETKSFQFKLTQLARMASSSSSMSSRPIHPKSDNSSPPIKSSSARDSTSRLLWQGSREQSPRHSTTAC